MKQYQVGDMMLIPFEGEYIEAKILHIPQPTSHPMAVNGVRVWQTIQKWIFEHPQFHNQHSQYYRKGFGIQVANQIKEYQDNGHTD